MRLYSFGNMYLQGVQSGIQCQHCTVELLAKYGQGDCWEWATKHKTTILLNGGNQRALMEIVAHLDKPENTYQYADFVEDLDSLNGALTNVCIILPEKIYMYRKWSEEAHAEVSEDGRLLERWVEVGADGTFSPGFSEYRYTKWELGLIEIINSKRLMS